VTFLTATRWARAEPRFIRTGIRGQGLPYRADPGRTQPGVISHQNGGRGVYLEYPDGHLPEILTHHYGGG
jgi:hypothetical protein